MTDSTPFRASVIGALTDCSETTEYSEEPWIVPIAGISASHIMADPSFDY